MVAILSDDFNAKFNDLDTVPKIKLVYNNKKEMSLVSSQHVANILYSLEDKVRKERMKKHAIDLPSQYNLSIKEIKIDQLLTHHL